MGLPLLCGICLVLIAISTLNQKLVLAIGFLPLLPTAKGTLTQVPLECGQKVTKKLAGRNKANQHSSFHQVTGSGRSRVAPSRSARLDHAQTSRLSHAEELGPSINNYMDSREVSLAQRRTVSAPVVKRYLAEVKPFASWALLQPVESALKQLGQPVIDQLWMQYLDRPTSFKCKMKDLVHPIGSVLRLTLSLPPAELLENSMTFEQDKTLMPMVMQYNFNAACAHRFLSKQKRKADLLLNCTQSQVIAFMLDLWRRHGLEKLVAPHLYRLRHASASVGLTDQQLDRATLPRQQAPPSTRRYVKGGRLSRMTVMLPDHVVNLVHARLRAKLSQLV